MAALARNGCQLLRPWISSKGLLGLPVSRAYAGAWNKDWKPGPFPRTPEEHEAAAKKYGMRPEDYQPYPDDGFGYGDYPKLPDIGEDSKDPHELYDIPELRRNYGEPVHVHSDMFTEERYNPSHRYRYSWWKMYGMCFGAIGGLSALYWLTLPYPHFHPVLPKQFPKDGPHYTFEQLD